jgi:uncharacterized membrane-anchored protein
MPWSRAPSTPVGGVVRVDKRTKRLTGRLKPGEIAVIDHIDIDRVAAEGLVRCRPAAVVNASPSVSGRYPNLGPGILLDAGIPVLDGVGAEVMSVVKEGEPARIEGTQLLVGDRVVAEGTVLTAALLEQQLADAQAGMATQIELFAANTLEYLRRERDLLLNDEGIPDVRTSMAGRQVLIVVRGYDYKEDLAALRPYIREYKPIVIGVDGGADAVLEQGLPLHMIVGDMDSVSDDALTSGAEIVVHAYRDGSAPGLARVQQLGVEPVVFPATGTSEDVAMLLADHDDASLIVAVGTHATLVEFLDKGRAGMASTFITRLRVGSKLVDAKGVSRLYRSRIPAWMLMLLLLAGVFALVVALRATPTGQTLLDTVADRWDAFVFWIRERFA